MDLERMKILVHVLPAHFKAGELLHDFVALSHKQSLGTAQEKRCGTLGLQDLLHAFPGFQ